MEATKQLTPFLSVIGQIQPKDMTSEKQRLYRMPLSIGMMTDHGADVEFHLSGELSIRVKMEVGGL